MCLFAGPSAAEPQPEPESEAPGTEDEEAPPDHDEKNPLEGSFEVDPRGVISVNAAWWESPLVPGSYGLYASRPSFDRSQFVLSPSSTVVGFAVKGVSFRDWELRGALDVSLKSPLPEQLSFALEGSYWKTDWKGLGDVDVWRGEMNTAIRF